MSVNFGTAQLAKLVQDSKHDVHERLRFVLVDRVSQVRNDETAIWWPALLFDSHSELQKSTPLLTQRLRNKIFMVMKSSKPGGKYAMLFGDERPRGQTVCVIDKGDEAKSLINFYIDGEQAQERSGNEKGFSQAVDEVMALELEADLTILRSEYGDMMSMYPPDQNKPQFTDLSDYDHPLSLEVFNSDTLMNELHESSHLEELPFSLNNDYEETTRGYAGDSNHQVTKEVTSINVTSMDFGDRAKEAQRRPLANSLPSTLAHHINQAEVYDKKEPLVVIESNMKVSNIILAKPRDTEERTKDGRSTRIPASNILSPKSAPIESSQRKSSRSQGKQLITLSRSIPRSKNPSVVGVVKSLRSRNQKDDDTIQSVPSQTRQTRIRSTLRPLTPSPPADLKQKKRKRTSQNESPPLTKDKQRPIGKYDPFSVVLDILKRDYGWSHRDGTGLISYYYIPPEQANVGTSDLQKNYVLGKDYFVCEETMRANVNTRYKWCGPRDEKKNNESPHTGRRTRRDRGSSPTETVHESPLGGRRPPRNRGTSLTDNIDNSDKEDKPTKSVPISRVSEVKHSGPKSESSQVESYDKSIDDESETDSLFSDGGSKKSESKPIQSKGTNSAQSPTIEDDLLTSQSKYSSSLINTTARSIEETDVNDPASLRDKLQQCIKSLNPQAISDSTTYDGSHLESKFTSNKQELMNFLKTSLQSYQRDGCGASSAIYLCGGPGTGKTTLVNHCIKLISESSEHKSVSLILNAATLQSPNNLLSEIAEKLGKKRSSASETIGQALQLKPNRKTTDSTLIVALDEIDFLLQGIQRTKDESSLLNTILQWASQPSYRLILIGISNSVGDECAKRLHNLVKFDKEIVFNPYTEYDMTEIVKRRLGKYEGLVERIAIAYVSKKVAKDNGDARYLLEIMSNAVTQCISAMKGEQLNEVGNNLPVIKLRNVMKALKDLGRTPYAGIIANLPQSQKVVLCIAMTLSQVSPAWKMITMSQLRDYCAQATQQQVLDELSIDSLVSIITALEDAGLLKVGEGDTIGRQDDNPYNWCLSLGTQLEDVECALGETLLDEGEFGEFYQRLCNYVRGKDKHNEY